MSGHSKWATIKRQKGLNDAKRGAVFTKLGNQIAIAARGGTDPTLNSNLAMVIEKAKAANMPVANIERAIKRVADKSASQLEEVVYEAYGPGGVGIIIEAATDNRNRTFPEIKTILSKNGGNIAEPGSVAFQFNRKGVVHIQASGEDALLIVLDCSAEDGEEQTGEIVAYTDAKSLAAVSAKLKDAGLKFDSAELQYVPSSQIEIPEEKQEKVLKVLELLEDHDDVLNVYTNME